MKRFFGGRGVATTGGFLLATAVSWSVLVGVAGAATLSAPTISGTAQQGQTLTATPGTPGPAVDTFAAPTYQWLACTTSTTCAPIAGATKTSLLLTSSEVGSTIEVTESVTDTSLLATPPNPATATSGPTAAVLPAPAPPKPAPAPPVNTTPPSISPSAAKVGQTLTANPGVWSPTPTLPYTYSWTSGGTVVQTGTAGTYLVAATDAGKAIVVSVVASNAAGSSPAAPSAAVGVQGPPANTAIPTISGTPQQGQVLTVTPGAWTNSPTSITDQWQDCNPLACTSIPGATGTSYTVGGGDVGNTIQVVETAVNAAAPSGVTAASSRTGTVSTTSTTSVAAFSPSSLTTNQGLTLVATVTSNSPNANPHGTLSFFTGLNAIPGCAGKPVNGGQVVTVGCQASFAAGNPQISAAYVADPTSLVTGSSSGLTAVSVGKSGTSVSLAVTPKVAPGGTATYLATLLVPASNAGPSLPGGSIEFLDGGQPIGTCASQPLSNLTATCTVSYNSPGTHNISALYNGDPNFTGATSSTASVQIVNGAPQRPTVHGSLGSTLGYRIAYHPLYSELAELEAYAVAKGTSITIQCYGKSCPFAKWHLAKAHGTISLLRRFRHRHLRAGTRITVRMTRRHWVGKYYAFTIRAGRAPLFRTACLAPGRVKPGVGCTSRSS